MKADVDGAQPIVHPRFLMKSFLGFEMLQCFRHARRRRRYRGSRGLSKITTTKSLVLAHLK